jgi:predicted ATPase/DNA-binding CsgD family transcriptional regulator
LSCFPTTPSGETFSRRELEILGVVAQGLSNHAIAQKLFLSLETVKWYNTQIYSKLDASNRTQAVAIARQLGLIEPGTASAIQPETRPKHNLPAPLTSYVGRRRERTDLQQQLAASRLVTVLGPGGSGKTRLALETARELAPTYPHGAWLVDLSPLADPDLVANRVAVALGLREEAGIPAEQQLVRYLRSRALLLVLDNCEHLAAACARLATLLLPACPGLRILATSREALGVIGEALFPLGNLAFPDPEHLPPLEALQQYEAVQLFSQRAGLVFPAFAVTPNNALATAQLCQRLDGLPLALELAAAQANLLSPGQMVDRLDARLWLLTTSPRPQLARHRSLQACLDWSHALLSQAEQVLLRRLAVFTGSWTLSAAEAICTDPPGTPGVADALQSADILELLAQLVRKSLVTLALAAEAGPQAERRYRLLDTIRQYAAEALVHTPDAGRAVRRQHAAFYLGWLVGRYQELTGHSKIEAIRASGAEFPNVQAAWDWAADQGQPELLLPAARSMCTFCARDEYTQTGEAICRTTAARLAPPILDDPEASPDGMRLLILLWGTQADLSCMLGDAPQAERLLQQAADLLERARAIDLQLKFEEAYLWYRKGNVDKVQLRNAQAQACFERALPLFRELGDRYWEAETMHGLSYLPNTLEGTRRLQEAALALFRLLGSPDGIAILLQEEGLNACRQGHFEEGERLIRESLALCQANGDRFGIALSTFRLGEALMTMGRFEAAQIQLAQGLAGLEEQGSWFWARLCAGLLSETEAYLGNYERARQMCQAALAETHDSYFLWGVQVYYRILLGLACLGAGQTAEAQGWLAAACEEAGRIDKLGYKGWSLALLGTADLQLGQVERARGRLRQALQIWEQCKNDDILRFSLPAVAWLLAVRGEARRAGEAYALAHRDRHFTDSRWFGDVFEQPLAVIASLPEEALTPEVQLDINAAVQQLLGELTPDLGDQGE